MLQTLTLVNLHRTTAEPLMLKWNEQNNHDHDKNGVILLIQYNKE